MGFYRIEDTTYVDAFDIPSFFDDRLALYKEWHDFVFFDRGKHIFGLLNFAVHGNPYDAKRGYGVALAFLVDPTGKAHTAMGLIHLNDLKVSPYSPDFIGKHVAVTYFMNHSFKIRGEIDSISFDLNLPVVLPPVSTAQIALQILGKHPITVGMLQASGEMAKLWDKWVELPRLSVFGEIGISGTTHTIRTRTGYQDHEGGRFDWGSTWGWDTGVLLCDPYVASEPDKVSFLFYRGGPSDKFSHGGIIFGTKEGEQKYFDDERIRITRTGKYSGEQEFIPGVTRLLYPDYHPPVPQEIVFSATDKSDKIDITFRPRALCTIVVASIFGKSETTFNEMFCEATLKGTVGEDLYDETIPSWFESVRPRGGMNNYAAET